MSKLTFSRALGAIVVLIGATACRKTPAPPPAPARLQKASTIDARPAAAKARLSPEAERAAVEQDIRVLVDKWVAAQNGGDFPAYVALYEPTHFRGLKRTQAGKSTRTDWAAWRADRAKMFEKGGMTVAVEHLTIETWLDKGATLRPGVSQARFVQRWRNARYADHGTKVLQLLRTKAGMAILYEDMLTSMPGWDRSPRVDAGGVFELPDDAPTPRTFDEAMALWRRLALTQDTVLGATFALAGFAGADLMAEALLRRGDFACKRYVDYTECGESHIEWQPIPPDTGWDDPCVQRTAALWAIETVKPKRLPALADVMVTLVGMAFPEEEIPEAVLGRMADMPEEVRLRVVRGLLATRCTKHGCESLPTSGHVAALEVKSRLALYRDPELARPARQVAIDGADLSRHPEVLVEVYGDETLDADVRDKLWSAIEAQKPALQERALRAAAMDKRCAFAMAAIDELADRGKKDLVPRAGKDDPERVLCLLLNARDQAWAAHEFRKLLPGRGKVLFIEASTDELDGEGGQQKISEEAIPTRDVQLGTLPQALGQQVGRVQSYTTGHSETVEVSFDSNGKLETVSRTSWSGCPC